MENSAFGIPGLSQKQVSESRAAHGWNRVTIKKKHPLLTYLKFALQEPMLLLLIAASAAYFIHGDRAEGIFLAVAIVMVSSISLFQDSRSRNALEALKKISQPLSKVIRDGATCEIAGEEIVIGDSMLVEEGNLIPADGEIVRSHDFSVNEAILTGESIPVSKDESKENSRVYQGTFAVTGQAVCTVTAIGEKTKMGQIGKSLQDISGQHSPLQIKINSFVKYMAYAGSVIFVLIGVINFYRSHDLVDSILKALTIGMSILPEEIPVAFVTFMALGAWRLGQQGVIVKDTKTVETLGSANIICLDKTGTITKNEMAIACIYDFRERKMTDEPEITALTDTLTLAMWSSEPVPFDPMEKSIHDIYTRLTQSDLRPGYTLVHEYPLAGRPPLMTHIFRNQNGDQIIAAKGAPEAILHQSDLSAEEVKVAEDALSILVTRGFRVLGVGEAIFTGNDYPLSQSEFRFHFTGFVAFYDPPKEKIGAVIQSFYDAGLAVKIITGDTAGTTSTIARAIGFRDYEKTISGETLLTLSDSEVKDVVMKTHIFTRMFPEAKLRIIQALKAQHQIVAMLGDGVNDAPALKAAHIGIAMGKKGSEVARQASSLVLANDDLSKLIDGIAMGRKIYNNLKKAIQYIISIHLPIILIVFIPLVLGWVYPSVFTPVHIIFLELIMGPTCSIIYENEPLEKNLMHRPPVQFTKTFFNIQELALSIVQGAVITAGLILVYQLAVTHGQTQPVTTAMVFLTLITANIALTLSNRSFVFSIFTTIRYKNKLIPLMLGITVTLVAVIFLVAPLRSFFRFEIISLSQVITCIGTGIASVAWFEVYKWIKNIISKQVTALHHKPAG
jgi:P-type Ca2+ transporter type 2C